MVDALRIVSLTVLRGRCRESLKVSAAHPASSECVILGSDSGMEDSVSRRRLKFKRPPANNTINWVEVMLGLRGRIRGRNL
ncbi:hypothetical protein PC119_g5214 [Phytophthora cactorum]|uniref:Uncharacterized protein n=1 Tax=Phytophthora cactorum TaxID=29920 RepID=A0A8T1BRK9_9STRA|nr:hypothetical protein PC112_g17050 [Phytophthora cactorum]KAG2908921.1 hypothetical protein PC117_g19823 [Phytophthora cactorum]KAG3033648.1 hypothetical protein PC119_g5214 [Phytophthora cactorum]